MSPRVLLAALLGLGVIGTLLLALGYRNAVADPVIRRAQVEVADWPAGTPPVTVLALSDVHVSGPDMPPERLRAVLRRLNGLGADLVLVAGDLVSEKSLATRLYPAHDIVSALSVLEAPMGMIVVPGNHDYWAGIAPFDRAFAEADIPFLKNTAVRRGPLLIAALNDVHTGNADIAATLLALDRLGEGPAVLLTHSPDAVPMLPRQFAAIFVGHTHCGQIVLPVIGALSYASNHGSRFGCGAIMDGVHRIFVTAGLGTSILPLRFGAPPDVWLVTLGPEG